MTHARIEATSTGITETNKAMITDGKSWSHKKAYAKVAKMKRAEIGISIMLRYPPCDNAHVRKDELEGEDRRGLDTHRRLPTYLVRFPSPLSSRDVKKQKKH